LIDEHYLLFLFIPLISSPKATDKGGSPFLHFVKKKKEQRNIMQFLTCNEIIPICQFIYQSWWLCKM